MLIIISFSFGHVYVKTRLFIWLLTVFPRCYFFRKLHSSQMLLLVFWCWCSVCVGRCPFIVRSLSTFRFLCLLLLLFFFIRFLLVSSFFCFQVCFSLIIKGNGRHHKERRNRERNGCVYICACIYMCKKDRETDIRKNLGKENCTEMWK